MLIYTATIADLQALLTIDPSKKELSKYILEGKVLVAKRDSVILGYVAFGPDFFNQAFIHLVIVDPQFRRQGIGEQLMQEAEKRVLGAKIFTSTNVSNKTAQAFFGKLGYKDSGLIDNLDEGDPEIVLFKAKV